MSFVPTEHACRYCASRKATRVSLATGIRYCMECAARVFEFPHWSKATRPIEETEASE